MWTCPNCGRTFKRKDQQHTCTLISKDSLFAKRPPGLKTLYEKIVKQVEKFGNYREETVNPDVIFFKTKSTFLAVKVKKDHLDIEFFLDHLEDTPPVSKYLQTSKYRVAHVVPVDRVEEINEQLISWIKNSYLPFQNETVSCRSSL
jgi:predicted transport protein